MDETQIPASINHFAEQSRAYVAPPNQPKVGHQILIAFAYVFLGFFLLSMFFAGWKSLLPSLGSSRVKWIEYRPNGMDMTVMMPNEPKAVEPVTTPLANGSMINRTYVSSVVGQGQAVFTVVEYAGGEDAINPELTSRILEAELGDLMKRMNAIPISKNHVPYKGVVALEFVTQPLAGQGSTGGVQGKMFMIKNRLYLFMITAKEGSELFAGKDKFLDPVVPNTAPYNINVGMPQGH